MSFVLRYSSTLAMLIMAAVMLVAAVVGAETLIEAKRFAAGALLLLSSVPLLAFLESKVAGSCR